MKYDDILNHLDHAEQTSRLPRHAARAIRAHLDGVIEERDKLRKEVEYMDSMVAHARRLALDLECMCLAPDAWYETALDSVCSYKADLEALFPQDPSYMGEPVMCGCETCTESTQNSASA